MRRPFGVAVLDVTAILKRQTEGDEEKPTFVPCVPCGEHESLDALIRKVTNLSKEVTQKEQRGIYFIKYFIVCKFTTRCFMFKSLAD